MKLKDYLHYYFQGQCLEAVIVPCQDLHFERAPITIKTIHNYHAGLWEVKPLLRRLEDMTEEEAEQLALIYSGADSVRRTTGVASNWHYYLCVFSGSETEKLTITADGSAWYAHYFDKTQPGFRNIVNEHQATHYLLQQHFDLFGLIDAGLAVDTKTTTP